MEFENFEPDQMSVVLCQNINNDTFKDARELIDRGIVPKKLSVTSQKWADILPNDIIESRVKDVTFQTDEEVQETLNFLHN